VATGGGLGFRKLNCFGPRILSSPLGGLGAFWRFLSQRRQDCFISFNQPLMMSYPSFGHIPPSTDIFPLTQMHLAGFQRSQSLSNLL
jgi:hypothetical protein